MPRIFLFVFLSISCTTIGQNSEYGPFKTYYPNGKIREEGERTATKDTGTIYFYFRDYLIKKVEYTHTFSIPIDIKNYRSEELITHYNDRGTVVETEKHIDGKPQPHGVDTYANGQMKREIIGNPNGAYTSVNYHMNGQKASEYRFVKDGRINWQQGISRRWAENGVMISEVDYKDNKKHGVAKYWNQEGILTWDSEYVDGKATRITRWNDVGKLTSHWDKKIPEEEWVQYKYREDQVTPLWKQYYKRFQLDGEDLVLKYEVTYDLDGTIIQSNIRDADVRNNITLQLGAKNIISEDNVWNMTFHLYPKQYSHRDEDTLRKLYLPANPQRMGFWIKNELEFPVGTTLEEYDKKIDDALDNTVKMIKRKKVGPNHQTDLSNIPMAREYYKQIVRKVMFTGAHTESDFDSTMTGDYSIYYHGTDMYFSGHLENGLLHGKAILHLNDSMKLFEREYRFGMQHGPSKEWFVTGDLGYEMVHHRGRLIEYKYYYFKGGVAEHKRQNKNRQTLSHDKFNRDQTPISMSWTEGNIRREVILDSIGGIEKYSWGDTRKDIYVSRYYYMDKDRVSIHIPPVKDSVYTFDIDRMGINISGKFWWDDEAKVNRLEDNIGSVEIINNKEISYPESLPCKCEEYSITSFFAPIVSKYVKQKKFERYQHDFHAPLDANRFFGDPYYLNKQPDMFIPGKEYSTYSNYRTISDITFHLPDTNGIALSLAPCRSKYSFVNIPISVTFQPGAPNKTKARFSKLKTLGLTFPKDILQQVKLESGRYQPVLDENGKSMPGRILFTGEYVNYDKEKELDVINPRFNCSKPMKVGNTNIIFVPTNIFPDVSSTQNYEEMQQNIVKDVDLSSDPAKEIFADKEFRDFRGVYSTYGSVHLQCEKEIITFQIEQVAVSAERFTAMLYARNVKKEGERFRVNDAYLEIPNADCKLYYDEKTETMRLYIDYVK